MPHHDSVLFGKNIFRTECWPPPPDGTWSTKNRAQMRAVMDELTIARAWVPTPAFNGLVVGPKGGLEIDSLDNGRELVRSSLPLEGYELGPHEALISAAGGCMFIVALGRGFDGRVRMVATHAGRFSIIDKARIVGRHPRLFEGVVHAIVESYRRWEVGPHQLELKGFWPIPAASFLHPLQDTQYGSFNRTMLEDIRGRWGGAAAYEVADAELGPSVAISTREIFLEQARHLGVRFVWCDDEMKADGILAHTRHPDPKMREKRNCVVIHRTS